MKGPSLALGLFGLLVLMLNDGDPTAMIIGIGFLGIAVYLGNIAPIKKCNKCG